MSLLETMTDREQAEFVFDKAEGLAAAIQQFLSLHEMQAQGPISDLASTVDWVKHFQKAMAEYNSSPGDANAH